MCYNNAKEVIKINQRIKEVRKAAGLTLEKFGQRIGITASSCSTIESGKSNPSNQTIVAICREFGVSKQWLVEGVGEMYVKRDLNQEIGMMVTALMKDADESFRKRFIAALLQVPPDGWNAIEEFVNKLSTAEKEPRSD
jgi:transcriptional regulator with XRE-family HTH domain